MGNLPVGYRFKPTDGEIISFYLPLKLKGEIIPHDCFVNCDLYGDKEPWMIFDKNLKETFYAFTKLKKITTKNGSVIKRTAGIGNWDCQNIEIVENREGRSIGVKKSLVFQVEEGESEENGHWVIDEYSVHPEDEYVICRIRNKDMDEENLIKKRILAMEENDQQAPKRFRVSDLISLSDQEDVIQGEESSPADEETTDSDEYTDEGSADSSKD
ncbi:hypothetical protein JCGZ_11068 [Jatropha curcas]|uniref:NAC transcription factor 077 n=2 Tax=Jatropha curcas TaxID=180498 RepID=R4N7S7_JATCU|nr:NAC transcription factor 077 [Jatropha curcas]KDP34518.1 hypothetical protein JCGZ_11068 [Jatropha curcas]